MTPCGARVSALNEDGYLICDLTAEHLGPHWDDQYKIEFSTTDTDWR